MKGFELYEPTTVSEAVGLLQRISAATVKVVGGGSDLVGGVMKDWVQGKGMPLPEALVDITTIPDLNGIKVGRRWHHHRRRHHADRDHRQQGRRSQAARCSRRRRSASPRR